MPKVSDQVNAGTEHHGVPRVETKPTPELDAAPSFTPAPWFNNAGVSIDGVKGKTIVWLDEDTTEADAALIIAAPKLYEAVKLALVYTRGQLEHAVVNYPGKPQTTLGDALRNALALAGKPVTSDESGTTTER